jgi:hypothetical protein
MQITVTLKVNVNVDEWQAEYHLNSAAEALKDVLRDLRTTGNYLASEKYAGLAEVTQAQAVIIL